MPTSPPPPHSMLPVGRIGLGMVLLASLAAPFVATRKKEEPPSSAPEQVEAPGMWATDIGPDAGPAPTGERLVPREKLLPGQRPVPCEPPDQVAIGPGCWVEVARRPPCGVNFYRHAEACYLPVVKRAAVPSSVSP